VCQGIGTEFIDIGNASSRMKEKELHFCHKNGVDLTEIKVGYDGIVLAHSHDGTPLNITRAQLGMALTAEIPQADGTWIPNPYKNWSDIDASLPNIPIKVMGPPTTSGTRASFVEMVNQKGYCAKDPVAKAASKARGDKKGKKCRAMRTDGAYIEAGEQDNLIVQKLSEDKNTYGIFGFSYLDQNTDTIMGALIDGVEPTFENIADGSYPVSRDLWFYIKHAHVQTVPGLKGYMMEWTKHWGEDGILADAGMIPMSEEERAKYKAAMENLPKM
jgi:phosphate transport system substrate-binding protein